MQLLAKPPALSGAFLRLKPMPKRNNRFSPMSVPMKKRLEACQERAAERSCSLKAVNALLEGKEALFGKTSLRQFNTIKNVHCSNL